MVKVKKSRLSGLLLALGGALVGATALKKTQTYSVDAEEVRGKTNTDTDTKPKTKPKPKTRRSKVGKESVKEEEKEMCKKKKKKCSSCCSKKNKKGFKYVIKYN